MNELAEKTEGVMHYPEGNKKNDPESGSQS
jgi:hypothetical protein